MPRVTRPDGELVTVYGASRSGKTAYVAQQVASAPRLLAWDAAEDWSLKYNCQRIASPLELRARIAAGPKLERLAYVRPCTAREFEFFCRLAWVWIRQARGALIVEELADVTHPGKAPVAWGEIIRKGLRYGPRIFALAQRPSEADKTVLGNSSRIHAHRLAFPSDRAYMAACLGVPMLELEKLAPLEWIERDQLGRVTRGRVSFGRARAARNAPAGGAVNT